MERVGILINKLQEQLQQQADVQKMLTLAQMLYTELLQEKEKVNGQYSSHVLVSAPGNTPKYVSAAVEVPVEIEAKVEAPKPVAEERVVKEEEKPLVAEVEKPVVTEVEKAVVEERLAVQAAPAEKQKVDLPYAFVYNDQPEIKQQQQPGKWAFDPVDFPTLAQQEKVVYELHEESGEQNSLNDKLKEEKTELGTVLHEVPIRDLKKAISINDRHRFIDALFRGDEVMYERSIKTINNFSIFAEAEFWIERELKLKLGWNTNLSEVKLFDQLVKRRFS